MLFCIFCLITCIVLLGNIIQSTIIIWYIFFERGNNHQLLQYMHNVHSTLATVTTVHTDWYSTYSSQIFDHVKLISSTTLIFLTNCQQINIIKYVCLTDLRYALFSVGNDNTTAL